MRRTLAALLLAPALAGAEMPSDPGLELVLESEQAPGNVTVTPDGQVIYSHHQFYGPDYRVMVLGPDGPAPFPSAAWSSEPGADGIGMTAVLGLRADPAGIVWMLDNGSAAERTPRIVAWDLATDRLHRILPIPEPATRPGSFHNDLAVDPVHGAITIADFGSDSPALVVVDLETGFSRRVLEGHPAVLPADAPLVIEGRPLRLMTPDGPVEPKIGVNPITIDPTNSWVYFGAMHGRDLWRLPARALADPTLGDEALGDMLERYGDKPYSDGITVDAAGNVYVTEIAANAIGVTGPDGTYRRYVEDDRLIWPDGLSNGPDGWIYVTVNKLHRSAALNAGVSRSAPPYSIFRFRAAGPTVPGR